jgi:hypothetical protein
VAAGIARLPEDSEHTSIKERVEHGKRQGRLDDLRAALPSRSEGRLLGRDPKATLPSRSEGRREKGDGNLLCEAPGRAVPAKGSRPLFRVEETHWLCPIEDRRRIDSSREGMLEGFSLGNYLVLVDYTGRLFREGNASLSREVAGILERIGTTDLAWQARLEKLSKGRLLGRFFAASRQRLREVAERLRLKRVPNLGGCLVS